MKTTAKLFSVLLTGVMACGALAGCTGGGGTEQIDSERTQLYVQNFEGGFGSDWLRAAKVRFEEKFKDKVYETGKKGVQIVISPPAKTDGISLRPNLHSTVNEVFFNESVYYYDYIRDGLLLDITDAITEPLTEFGESESIADKMSAEQRGYYLTDGKYYGIPHYAGYNGIVYDVDLFDKYCLYFADGADMEFIVNPEDKRSAGPDGAYGTADDGLPATYDEFFRLCEEMVSLSITPITWPGQYFNTYIEKVINALYADDVGLEQTMLNYTFRGTAKNIISPVEGDGSYTYMHGDEGVEITPKNAYLLSADEGKYHALTFFETLVRNSANYNSICFSPSHLYTDSQKDFLESTPKGAPIAMMVEGCWWENEAKDSIKTIADYYGDEYSRENRHFAMLPLPKSGKKKIGQKSTIVDTHYSLGFIKSDIADFKVELAKEFLRFCCTDESLSEFTVSTNSVKALDYNMSETDYAKLTTFGKSVYDLHKSSDIVYPFSSEAAYLDHQSMFSVHESYYSKIGNKESAHPIEYLREGQSNNMIDFFNGMLVYNQERWDRVFGGYD